MPKLGEGGFGSKFGYQIDKMNESVGFEDSTHTYFDLKDGGKYISVTTLLKNYEHEFQGDFWAFYNALEFFIGGIHGLAIWDDVKKTLLKTKRINRNLIEKFKIDPEEFKNKEQEILDSYKKAGEDAREKGTRIHLAKELSFYDEKTRDVAKYGIGGKVGCTRGKYILDDYAAVYPELLISCDLDGLRICGQADFVCKCGNDIYILDWKTSKKIEKTSFFDRNTGKNEKLKFPLNNIMASNYWIYSLQLSIYMFLLQQEHPEFVCKKLAIVQIDDDMNETVYECEYLKDDVERLLKHYKRSLKTKEQLDKNKPIKL